MEVEVGGGRCRVSFWFGVAGQVYKSYGLAEVPKGCCLEVYKCSHILKRPQEAFSSPGALGASCHSKHDLHDLVEDTLRKLREVGRLRFGGEIWKKWLQP